MKNGVFGDYVFEYMLITFLLLCSIPLIIPFPLMVIGVVGYFKKDIHSRRYADIFKTIKDNLKIGIIYSFFISVLIVFSVLNLYFNLNKTAFLNNVMTVVSYLTLMIGAIYLITGPTIIVYMNVNFKELLYNGFMLILGKPLYSFLAILILISLIALILYFPYIVILLPYFITLVIAMMMKENFLCLKAKVLGVTVDSLKKEPSEDDDYTE